MVTWLHCFGVCRKEVLRQKSATEQNLLQGQGEKNGERKWREKGKKEAKEKGETSSSPCPWGHTSIIQRPPSRPEECEVGCMLGIHGPFSDFLG